MTTKSHQSPSRPRLIFFPYEAERVAWDTFIMLALVYTSVEIPLSAAFNLHLSLNPPNTLGVVAFTIDMLLLLDIALNFRTAYFYRYDKLTLIVDPSRIAKRYIRGWFFFDILTSLPLEFMITNPQYDELIKVARFIKLLRVLKVFKLFNSLTKQFVQREAIITIKLFKIMGAMILTAHYFACIWFYVGIVHYEIQQNTNDSFSNWIEQSGLNLDDQNVDLFVQYSYAWYWAIVTLFTTGYGDITAHNPTEQWVCSLCILAGSCLFAYFIGTLTAVVAEGDRVRSYEISRVEEAKAFCDHHKFDPDLTRKVLTHIRYFCHYNFILDQDEIVSSLPPFLQKEVQQHVSHHHLKLSETDLFKGLPGEIIGQISLTMNSISCNTGQYLYKTGDIAQCLYLQRTGRAVLKYGDIRKSRPLQRGDIIGEQALIYGKRKYSVACQTWSEFYVLRVDEIKRVFLDNFKPKRFKKEWKQIRQLVNDDQNKDMIRKCNFGGRSRGNSFVNENIEGRTPTAVNALSIRKQFVSKSLLENLTKKTPISIVRHAHDDESESESNQFPEQDTKIPMNSSFDFTSVQSFDVDASNCNRNDNRSSHSSVKGKNKSSLLRKLSTFNFRQNSEQRNQKVLENNPQHVDLDIDGPTLGYASLALTTRYRSVDEYELDLDFSASDEVDGYASTQLHLTSNLSGKKAKMRKKDIGMKTMGKYSRHRKQKVLRSKSQRKHVLNRSQKWMVVNDVDDKIEDNNNNENEVNNVSGAQDMKKEVNGNTIKSDNNCSEFAVEMVHSIETDEYTVDKL